MEFWSFFEEEIARVVVRDQFLIQKLCARMCDFTLRYVTCFNCDLRDDAYVLHVWQYSSCLARLRCPLLVSQITTD